MSVCPTCGNGKSNVGKIVLCVVGFLAAGMFGFAMMVVICLSAIASIGEASNSEYEQISNEISATQAANLVIEESFEKQ